MAIRPVFIPQQHEGHLVRAVDVQFKWVPGMAVSQVQKCIASLHKSAKESLELNSILEISSKSQNELGVKLSAFNLKLNFLNMPDVSIESAFQGSKVFEGGGPYTDLLKAPSRQAKQDDRIKKSGALVAFEWNGQQWPLQPVTAFYDWLYIQGLLGFDGIGSMLNDFDAFTDIAFNPKKSLNCQASSAALFVSLQEEGLLDSSHQSIEAFLELLGPRPIEADKSNQEQTRWEF